jgi:sulfite reductase (NADPH) hemoprotein beta-component
MAAMDDAKTLGRTRLSFSSEAEIEEFVATLEKFEAGALTPDQWRAFRLVRGTYGQRQSDVQMLRVKIPQGILDQRQLNALADVAQRYSRSFGHITTRQNIQFHFVKLSDVEDAMRLLADAGLTTREACGNSVRNITGCPYAGVAADEAFDVTPYAEALTRYLLRHPLSSTLPRKFKIAFEGCLEDHALTAINDLGWRARTRDAHGGSERGFQLTVGGGTAISCQSGNLLFPFVPAGEIFNVAEAVLRVFHRFGDREHKQRNRMKFLIRQLGWERWKQEVDQALQAFRAEGGASLPFDAQNPPNEDAPNWQRPPAPSAAATAEEVLSALPRGPGIHPQVAPEFVPTSAEFRRWRSTNLRPQKQPGFSIATVTLPLGDVTGQQMRVLAALSSAFGDGTVRVTPEQNLLLRWVPDADVAKLYQQLAAAGLSLANAGTLADVTSCPGAESCRIAVTQSRGLGQLLGDYLREHPHLVEAAGDVRIKISGCPNGCGHHHIAGIGFQGSVRKLGGKAVPQYFVLLGGGVDQGGARFGRLVAKVPARRVPQVLECLIALYLAERREGESATTFFARLEVARAKATLADLEQMNPAEAEAVDFVDLGEHGEFLPEAQAGECAA